MARNGVKTGGRQKGSINKKTAEVLDRVGRVLDIIETQYLEKDIKALSPHQRMTLYSDMMEYKAPKLSRTDMKIDGDLKTEATVTIFELPSNGRDKKG